MATDNVWPFLPTRMDTITNPGPTLKYCLPSLHSPTDTLDQCWPRMCVLLSDSPTHPSSQINSAYSQIYFWPFLIVPTDFLDQQECWPTPDQPSITSRILNILTSNSSFQINCTGWYWTASRCQISQTSVPILLEAFDPGNHKTLLSFQSLWNV